MKIEIFTDGGSRGNPGEAACAFMVQNGSKVLDQGAAALGIMTNNDAEYNGFLLSLRWLQQALVQGQPIETVVWKLDSKLVVEQLNRHWKIKEPRMVVLAKECWSLLEGLSVGYSIIHVPREQNALADALLNNTLDSLL